MELRGEADRSAMTNGIKFDPKKIDRLKDPERLRYLNPDTIWEIIGQDSDNLNNLVDIGAGIGYFAVPFSRKIPDGRVYACDISEEMLGHLSEALKVEGADNVTPLKSDEVKVPLPDGAADLVLMANLHHELEHPEESLTECHRLLRAGGLLAVIDWKPEETPMGPPVPIRIPPDQVRRQMENAGFREIRSHPRLPYHYFITSRR